jgi:hypothetical protein
MNLHGKEEEHFNSGSRLHVAKQQTQTASRGTNYELHRTTAAAISGSWRFPFNFVKSSVISDLNEQLLPAPQNEINP